MVRLWRKIIISIRKMSIFFKVTALFEVVMVFTIVLVASYININYISTLKEKEITLGTSKLEKFSSYINEKYNRVYNLSNYIHSGQISHIMAKVSEDNALAYHIDYIKSTRVFSQGIFSADSDISDVILISKNKVVYSSTVQGTSEVKPSYDFMENTNIKELLKSDSDMLITIDTSLEYTLKSREPVVSFIGKIFDADQFPKRKLVGVYIINIPYSKIETAIGEKEAIRGNILLVNKADKVLFSSDQEQLGKVIEYKKEGVSNSGKNDFFEIWEVGLSGLKVAYIFEEKALYAEIYKNMHKTYLILGVAIAITLIWSWCVCQVFNKRVRILTESMSYVQKGDFSHRIPIKSQDEIGLLSEAFNDMCEKLNDYIAKVYHSEIKLKNAEVNALQTQINPHFLYNTLESIKAEALVNNDVTTAQMISQLGNLFRWSSKIDDKIVSLEDELDYINTYLELQQFRFHNNLKVDILVADDLLDYGVPKLILQPIIENTIKHGLRLGEQPGFIKISAEENTDHRLEILINDNGKGMTEERLTKIHKKLKKVISQEDFGSIGMQNVHQRLRLMFGAEFGLTISSREGQGTTVKLILPAMFKKEMEKNV